MTPATAPDDGNHNELEPRRSRAGCSFGCSVAKPPVEVRPADISAVA